MSPTTVAAAAVSSMTRLRDTQNAIAGSTDLNQILKHHYSTVVVQVHVHDHEFYDGSKGAELQEKLPHQHHSRNDTRAQWCNKCFNGSKALFPNTRHLVKQQWRTNTLADYNYTTEDELLEVYGCK